jgi:RNA polymerase sigma-70 factor (ECF subfamily)
VSDTIHKEPALSFSSETTTEILPLDPAPPSAVAPPSFDDAFATLFRERFTRLYRYLKRVSGDSALADDVAQESFVRLHARGTMPSDPAAWLVAVANNLVRDEHRSDKRHRRLLELWVGPAEASRRTPPSDARVLAQEREAAVRKALEVLPLRDQRLLILRHEGFSYREIAEALGVAPSSVGTLLARATAAVTTAYRGMNHASD